MDMVDFDDLKPEQPAYQPMYRLEDLNYDEIMKLISDMEDESTKKPVYLFFRKSTGKLYAWTENKDVKKRFIKERGKGAFIIKKKILGENLLTILRSQNSMTELSTIPLYDGSQWIEIIGTNYEYDSLDESQSLLYSTIESIHDNYVKRKNIYHPRILKFMERATSIVSGTDDDEYRYIEIDTFKMFYHIFHDTFTNIDQ